MLDKIIIPWHGASVKKRTFKNVICEGWFQSASADESFLSPYWMSHIFYSEDQSSILEYQEAPAELTIIKSLEDALYSRFCHALAYFWIEILVT